MSMTILINDILMSMTILINEIHNQITILKFRYIEEPFIITCYHSDIKMLLPQTKIILFS
jgi:hypothetical protein